jgi:hypothetical protein
MGIWKWLKGGKKREVLGTHLVVKGVFAMTRAMRRRWGYADKDGYLTDLGWRRCTSDDYDKLGDANLDRE